jgi:AcrR family transcriptional regulator
VPPALAATLRIGMEKALEEPPVAPRGRQAGTGRRARTDAAILDATRAILAETGVRSLTVEGVAQRSGVAKTTIYRRWRGRHELALAVLIDMVDNVVATPDLGSTREEFVHFLRAGVRVLGTTLMGRVMQGLVSDLAADPELARAFRERVVGRRVAEVRRLQDRGVERGDLRPGIDVALMNELLFGPIYYRLLLSGGPLEPGLAEAIVDVVLPAFATAPSDDGVRE